VIKKIIFLFLIITGILAIIVCLLLKYLSLKTNTEPLYFPKLFISVQKHPSLTSGFNFLILGVDPRNDNLEKTNTTDTIIFANYSTNYKINLLSIPRDLWNYFLNAKINQIYPLSIGQTNQYQYLQSQFQQIINQKIDRTIVLTTQNLIDLVRLIGGVDVYLFTGFKDEMYPNPEYIASPSAKTPIYKTIEFPQGKIHLDENNITEFVRSRKGAETAASGGTDIGRIERQQILLNALFLKLKSIDYFHQPQLVFNLYLFFHQLHTNFSDSDLFSIFLNSYQHLNLVTINKINLSTGDNSKTNLLYHPTVFINSQWVFLPQDKDYSRFQEFISHAINEPNP